MPNKPTPPEYDIAFYEGLIRKTAGKHASRVEEDYDDICQILRIKVWRALGTYDPARSKLPVQRYVFSCVLNQVKDLLKKKRRNELMIEDMSVSNQNSTTGEDFGRSSWFEGKYLSEDEETALNGLLDEVPLIPSTLHHTERQVLALLYFDYAQGEIADRLGVTRREVSLAVKSIKEKMADWRPSNDSHAITEAQKNAPEPSAPTDESGGIRSIAA